MREMLIHRPFVLLAASLILGIVAPTNLFAAFLLIGLLIVVRDVRPCLACAIGFAAGVLLAPATARVLFPKTWVDIDATVVSVPRLYPTEKVAQVRVGSANLMLSGPPDLSVALGQTIRIQGNAKPLAEGSQRLADRGIQGRIWADRAVVVREA